MSIARFGRRRAPARIAPPPPQNDGAPDPQAHIAPEAPPRPTVEGSVFLLLAIGITTGFMTGDKPSDYGRFAATTMGLGIALSALCDLQRGLRNLIRADFFAIFAFYFFTFFEFLFPQPNFDRLVTLEPAQAAINVCLVGFAGLVIGRHFSQGETQPFRELLTRPVSNKWLLLLFWISLFLGFLHMFVAVDFNPVKVIEHMMGPRFSQPWGRGRFGDWKALFVELHMLLYLAPPLAGIMFARRQTYSPPQFALVMIGLGFLMFYAFSTGTRNIFHSFLITFLIGYVFSLQVFDKRKVIPMALVCAGLILVSTVLMVQFRSIGLKKWFSGDNRPTETRAESLSVDLNLYPISKLTETFPEKQKYVGLEIYYLTLIRPIPRAIWKGKPEGLSTSIESAVGANEGWTVAASFAGEAYMSGGNFAVLLVGLAFGWLASWWNRFVSPYNSQFGVLVYASGFFAVVISMRSIMIFTTAILPTIAAMIGGSMFIARQIDRRRAARLEAESNPQPQPRRAVRRA